MTIICATHFTDTSLEAVKVAAQLARTHREALWLLNVMPHAATAGGEDDVAVTGALLTEASRLAREGLVVNTATVFGPLMKAVKEVCEAKRASLLVVGDVDQTLAPLVVGPLDRFADNIGVPALIVRKADSFLKWASGAAPLKVAMAMDGNWKSAAAREWIIRLASYGPIELVASYLWWPRDEAKPKSWAKVTPRLEADTSFTRLPSNVRYRVRLEVGDAKVGTRLLARAQADEADVFVVGTHAHRGPRGQQWSVSHEVLATAPMSVACVPDAAARLAAAPASPDTQSDLLRIVAN